MSITLGPRAFSRGYQINFDDYRQNNTNYAYITDDSIYYERGVTISGDGTYYLTFTFEHPTIPAIQASLQWRIIRSGGVNTVQALRSSGWVTLTGPPPTATNILFESALSLSNWRNLWTNETYSEEDLATTYRVTEVIYQVGDPVPSPSVAQQFDMRILSLRNLKPVVYKVNPTSKNGICVLGGDWMAYPVSTTLYPNGWKPTAAIGWDVAVWGVSWAERSIYGSSTLLATPVAGKVAEFTCLWDCKDAFNKFYHPGKTRLTVYSSSSVSVPNGGYTNSLARSTHVNCTRCSCADGTVRFSLSLFDGATMGLQVGYDSVASLDAPSSMGYGWKLPTGIRIYEDSGTGGLTYENESGGGLRWAYHSGTSSYQPEHDDNYATIVKESSNPDYVYAVSFPDQTRREFDGLGVLLREFDRNGNTISYDWTSGNLVMSDDFGRSLYFDYGLTARPDGQTQTVRVNDPINGRLIQFSYYSDTDPVSPDRLQSITDAAGETTSFVYDLEGNLIEVIDQRNVVAMAFTYDELGRKLSEQSYDQTLTEYVYLDGFNRAVQVTTTDIGSAPGQEDPPRQVTLYYDDVQNITRTVELVDPGDPLALPPVPPTQNETLMEYQDSLNPYLRTRTIAPNGSQSLTSYTNQGLVKTTTDDHGNVTTYTYAEELLPFNPKHRNLVRHILRPAVTIGNASVQYNATELEYNADGNLVKIIDALGKETEFDVNGLGQVEAVTDRNGHVSTMTYDPVSGNLATVTSAEGREWTFSYDDYDNLLSREDELGNQWSSTFDANDRPRILTDARGLDSEMHYSDGRLDFVELPPVNLELDRRRTTFSYDDSHRLLRVDSDLDSSTQTMRVRYEYSGFSNLRKLIRDRAGLEKTFSYSYDRLGRVQASEDPLQRLTSWEYAPYCSEFSVTSPRGVTRTSNFDTLCRPTRVMQTGEVWFYTHDELGRVIAVSQEQGQNYDDPSTEYGDALYGSWDLRRYEYDALDRLTRVHYPDNQTLEYEYDFEGNLVKQVDVLGNQTLYEYDNDNLLKKVIVKRTAQADRIFEYFYDAAGRLSEIAYPSPSGVVARFYDASNNSGWNENGQLTLLRYTKGGNHLHSFAYTYDDAGNRIQCIDTPENLGDQVTWDYEYDWLNRLSKVKKNGLSQSIYTYDESDNRIALELPQLDELRSYVYDDANQLDEWSASINAGPALVQETFAYDDDGNLTSRSDGTTTTNYTWNNSNRLIQIARGILQDSFEYDAEGIRKSRQDGTRFFSSGAMSINDTRTSGSVAYIQGHQLLGLEKLGSLYYYISDGLGSNRALVDASDGNVVARFDHSEFGIPTLTDDTLGIGGHNYVGALGVRDENDPWGLLYMRQRWYDPTLGRFLTPDPIGFEGGLNLYGYVGNNPVNAVDPSGLDTTVVVSPFKTTNSVTGYQGTKVSTYRMDVWQNGRHLGMFEISRDPYDSPRQAQGRYGSSNEAPPGAYYASYGPEDHRIQIGDSPGGVTIKGRSNGEEYSRSYIQFHPRVNSEGCLTFPASSFSLVEGEPFDQFKKLLKSDLDQTGGKVRVFILPRHFDSFADVSQFMKLLWQADLASKSKKKKPSKSRGSTKC